MDRRKSIKTLFIGGISIGVVAEACQSHEKPPLAPSEKNKEAVVSDFNRMKENCHEKSFNPSPLFYSGGNDHMTLGDIIVR
jgi:hypothetical protein